MSMTYDCLLIGMQPSGLLAAALLAKRGYRVGIVDQEESHKTYTEQTWKFPLLPGLMPNLEKSALIRRIHTELETPSIFEQAKKQPCFQAVFPKHRFNISPSLEDLLTEIEREIPAKKEIARRFFHQLREMQEQISDFLIRFPPLPPFSWKQRLTQKKWWRPYRHLHDPRCLLNLR